MLVESHRKQLLGMSYLRQQLYRPRVLSRPVSIEMLLADQKFLYDTAKGRVSLLLILLGLLHPDPFDIPLESLG